MDGISEAFCAENLGLGLAALGLPGLLCLCWERLHVGEAKERQSLGARAQQTAASTQLPLCVAPGAPGILGKAAFARARLEWALGALPAKPGDAEAEWKRMLSQKPDFSTHSISSPSVP